MKKLNTFKFGEVEVAPEKAIHFPNGLIGFPQLRNFMLLHEKIIANPALFFLQSIDDEKMAFVVVNPQNVTESYTPSVHEESLAGLGDLNEGNTLLLVILAIPLDNTKMTANLQAPLIINMDTMTGKQVIVADDYKIKQPVYEYLKDKVEEYRRTHTD